MISVHQLVPTISPRDAVGNHTLALRKILRDLGFESEIFSMFRHQDLVTETHYVDQLPGDADAVIYQMSIGSPVADRWQKDRELSQHHADLVSGQMGRLAGGRSAARSRSDGKVRDCL